MPKQNTAPDQFPHAVLEQITQLGRHIALARKRRGESQAQWAKRLGVSQPTMARIERGDPAVSMAFYVMAMWLINQAQGLADLIAPQHDWAALEKEISKVRSPARKASKRPATNAAALAGAPMPANTHTTPLVSEQPAPTALANQLALQQTPDLQAMAPQAEQKTSTATANKTSSLLARAAAAAQQASAKRSR